MDVIDLFDQCRSFEELDEVEVGGECREGAETVAVGSAGDARCGDADGDRASGDDRFRGTHRNGGSAENPKDDKAGRGYESLTSAHTNTSNQSVHLHA